MKRNPRDLAAGQFDLLVIGGGILGAGVARDAVLRGLRVALIDKGDFASGTSSRSSKLIHGGLRYLEQYDFRLVSESCRERRLLRELAPHLVQPCEFLFPVYSHDVRPFWKVRLGLTLYDLISRHDNLGVHRVLRPPKIAECEPGLTREGLRGAVVYHDCREDDARFCVETILDAGQHGAVCVNYCELAGFAIRGGTIEAARVIDTLTGDRFEIPARHFINAAGPWVEQVAGFAHGDTKGVALSPTKGVHLVVPALTQGRAITFQGRQDGRILFVIPWNDCSLVGTTDTDWSGDPSAAHATPADVEYLLNEAQALFPARDLKRADVVTTFAGIRSLIRSQAARPSSRTREHRIVQNGPNFFSLVGGKYTTFRLIAQQAVDCLSTAECRTAKTPLPSRRPGPTGEKISDSPPVFESDIAWACDEECAVTVTDIMRRRTSLALSRYAHPAVAEKVSRWMMPRLAWSEEQRRQSLEQYTAEWKANLP